MLKVIHQNSSSAIDPIRNLLPRFSRISCLEQLQLVTFTDAQSIGRLLEEIKPQHDDTIIGMGDYVDRGMEYHRVIDILIELVSDYQNSFP